MNPNIAARLLERAARHPDREAIVAFRRGRRESVTYGELASAVARIGTRMRADGIVPGDRVLLLVPMSIELYVSLLGTLHAGAVAVFLDAWAGRARIDAAIRLADPVLVIGGWKARLLSLLSPALRRILRWWAPSVARAEVFHSSAAPGPPAVFADDHPALVTFTTGSTGAPKGAERSHAFLWAQHLALAGHLDLREGEVDMPTLPVFVLNNLALGVTSVIPAFDPRRPARIDPRTITDQIDREHVATVSGSPAFFAKLCGWLQEQRKVLPVRGIWTGGAPVFPRLARILEETVQGHAHVVYGSTEAEPIAGIPAAEMVRLAETGSPGVCVGCPVPEIDLRIVPPVDGPIELGPSGWDEWEVPAGAVGEIVVAGPHVLGSYLNAPEQTRRTKIREGEKVWHRTGDAAWIDHEGRLWLMGRVDQRVERAGEVYWPTAAEAWAMRIPGVRHAAYLDEPNDHLGQQAVLCLELDRSAGPPPADAEVRNVLAPIPVDRVVRLRRIPRDPRHESKTDATALREQIRRMSA